nr:hypothetical protein CFP56_68285 [Quercus suber]
MDDLTGQWTRLSLHTKERQTIPLTPVLENNNRVLVAKLFTKRRVNVEALSRTLKSMWRFAQDFEVRDLASNTVLILFTHEADAQKKSDQQYGPWLRASLTTIQPPQLVRTKSFQPTAPSQPPRPTPSPFTPPSHPTENTPPPSPNPPTMTQNAETVAPADKPETASTHKEILSDPQLFDTFITELDHDLNYHPNSNTPNQLPQLAHAPLTVFTQHSYSTTKSTIPLTVNTDTLTTNHSDIPYPTHIPDIPKAPEPTTTRTNQTVPLTVNTDTLTTNHADIPYPTHIPDTPKAPEPTTTHTNKTVTKKTEPLHGTWRRLGLPRDTVNAGISCELVLGPKRKPQDVPLPDDPPNDKKQRHMEMEAKSLGKLMAEHLGSAVAARQHRRMQ